MSKFGVFAASLLLLHASAWAEIEKGLVAHWDFDEGKGDVLHDRSGNGNDGTIHGAKWVTCSKGYALRFDGTDDYVNCGAGPSLDIRDAISLGAWAKPDAIPVGEPGIVGKGDFFNEFFGITYYESGGCYFYISTGANNCTSKIGAGSWCHIAGTFDGTRICLYVNGRLVASRTSKVPKIDSGGDVFIGRNGAFHFRGLIDDVRIYNRALSKGEIRLDYETGVEGRTQQQKRRPLIAPELLENRDFAVKVGKKGGMEVSVGKSTYSITSSFSCPGEKVGRNVLAAGESGGEASWKTVTKKKSPGQIQVLASGEHYRLRRDIILHEGRIRIEDALTNSGEFPVGIITGNDLVGERPFGEVLMGGGELSSVSNIAENPTIFLSQKGSSLGVLAEDNVFRLQFEASSSLNQVVEFGVKHFALGPGKTYTFRWTLYPFGRAVDYFDFVNAVRRDWDANFAVQGPFDWINVANPLLDDPEGLKAYLDRRKLAIVGLLPFHAYWHGAPLAPEEYKRIMQKAIKAFKNADPEIKCLGCIENNIVAYERAKMKRGRLFDDVCRETGAYPLPLSAEQTRILEQELPWKDSLVKTRDGRAMIEDCKPKTFVQPMVYSEPGNYHTKYLMGQIRFLIEDVGMDGVYMDHFNMTFERQQRYHYSKWDGFTVDIDPNTGRIESKYTDAGLVGIQPRKELCDYVFSKGKVLVVNTQNVANETQAMPIMHFEEVGSNADPNSLQPGEEPPLVGYIAKLQLASPIGLGIPSSNKLQPEIQDAGEVMRTVIVYLRHGLLYYHNQTTIPETGPGSGEYGPINHMFPITPVRLFKGGVEGKERTVTCVSGTYTWRHERPPRILLFDPVGKEKQHDFKPERTDTGWQAVIQLRNWQEIAVIE